MNTSVMKPVNAGNVGDMTLLVAPLTHVVLQHFLNIGLSNIPVICIATFGVSVFFYFQTED